MRLKRWTPFTFLTPNRYVDTGKFWTDFDFENWARDSYTWTEDPWNGFLDIAKEPRETIGDETGDCEDFALVAVSWAVAHDREGVGIAFCWEKPYPWPRHVIAFDNHRIYSSGNISNESVEEWVEESKYVYSVTRRIT